MNSLDTCSSSRLHGPAGLLTLTLAILPGCALVGIDPDIIDLADETGEAADEVGQDASDGESGDTGDTSNTGAESSTGTEGSGTDDGLDSTSDSDTGGDTSGDTNDPGMCETQAGSEVSVGETPVTLAAGSSDLDGSCGGAADETVFWFTAPAAGSYTFSLASNEFTGVVYAVDAGCTELEMACAVSGESFMLALDALETVFVVVDADSGSGSGTLTITGP